MSALPSSALMTCQIGFAEVLQTFGSDFRARARLCIAHAGGHVLLKAHRYHLGKLEHSFSV